MRLKFTPEVLVSATSGGLVTSILEVGIVRLALFVTATEGCSVVRAA